jgi:large subunit ribosomal protein L18
MDRKHSRLRRARKTRAKIAELKMARLTVYRSNCHIYAQVIDPRGGRVLAAASTLEADLREAGGGNAKAAAMVGQRIAQKAKESGIEKVAFDRSGYKFHGRVKALAEAAREHGLKF